MLGNFFYKLPDRRNKTNLATKQTQTTTDAVARAMNVEKVAAATPIQPPPRKKQKPQGSETVRFFDKFNAGAGSWYVIHLLAASGEYDALASVLRVFGARFTCAKCRTHIVEATKSMPSREVSSEDLFYWTIHFHNEVNARLTQETGHFIPRVTQVGADALLRELTIEADRDGRELAISGTCTGCDDGAVDRKALKTDGFISTSPTQIVTGPMPAPSISHTGSHIEDMPPPIAP
jgi:hypothetical protein